MKRQQTGNSVKNFVQQIAKIQTFYRNIQARSTAYIKFYYKSVMCVCVFVCVCVGEGGVTAPIYSSVKVGLSASLFRFTFPN